MSKRPAILELRDSLRRSRSFAPAPRPLTRAEIEQLVDQRVVERLRDLLRTTIKPRRGGCG